MIEIRQRQVFYSPRRRRHFMTAIAAARAEANTRMQKFFPSEEVEYESDSGRQTYGGWSWREVPRLVAIHERLVARYLRQLGREKVAGRGALPVVSSPVEATAVVSNEQGAGEKQAPEEIQDAYTSHQGSICIDWDDDPKNQFSIIVKDGRVTYSAYRDGMKVFGVAKGPQFIAALRGFAGASAQDMHCGYLVDGVDFYLPDFPRSEWKKHKTVVPVYLSPVSPDDAALLDWLEDTVQGAHVSMCFELDGGVHLTIEAPSSEPVAYRERNTIREAITAAIKEKATRS